MYDESSSTPGSEERESFGCSNGLALQAGSHKMPEKNGEWLDILFRACLFQRCHVLVSLLHGYDGPGVTARCEHHVHQETPHAAVPIGVRMDVHEDKVPEHNSHRWFRFLPQ